MANQRRTARRKYNRASTTDEDDDRCQSNTDDGTDKKINETKKETIEITILDSAQNRFAISSIDPKATTVQQLKELGMDVHAVPPDQQRLIYMGKMLTTDKAGDDGEPLRLSDYGIDKEGCIVHLFPKPKVVIDRNNDGESSGQESSLANQGTGQNGSNAAEDSTAHIPQIILDASEAQRHSNVIILSSHEAFETLHRVRLCSFCLLVYSSMELLQDLALWMGGTNQDDGANGSLEYSLNDDNGIPPDEPTDTTVTGPFNDDAFGAANSDFVPQVWETIDYLDVVVSVCALWVAMLGIKVTTEHELVTARLFCRCLVVVAAVWNALNYWVTVRDIVKVREKLHADDQPSSENDDLDDRWGDNGDNDERDEMSPYRLALWYMSFLFFLWGIFLFWAYQFRKLMEEAAAEAEERTRSFLTDAGVGSNEVGRNSDEVGGDLELQVEGREIT